MTARKPSCTGSGGVGDHRDHDVCDAAWLTRSVFLPVKAILLTILSLTATFGALVFIFQDGHLRWLVSDFTLADTLNTLGPPLLFCVAFGLSIDYEVFMLSHQGGVRPARQ